MTVAQLDLQLAGLAFTAVKQLIVSESAQIMWLTAQTGQQNEIVIGCAWCFLNQLLFGQFLRDSHMNTPA